MANQRCPEPVEGWLTTLQAAFLTRFFATDTGQLFAILGRTEPKDFVDLYFILHAGYDFDDLLAKAQEKDLSLQPFFMAGTLLQVRNLRHLPATTPPLTLPELQGFIIPLADRLLDRSRPPGN